MVSQSVSQSGQVKIDPTILGLEVEEKRKKKKGKKKGKKRSKRSKVDGTKRG